VTTQTACEAAGGTYQGDGTSCTPDPCAVAATGACCATDDTCSVTTQADCEAAGGTYQGDDTSCTPDPCAAAGPDGAALYATNCSACHGSDGSNGFAPDVTNSTAAELTTGLQSASHAGVAELTAAEVSAIADFLGS
jgi:mono/diheme cytochrome c family protein